MKPENGEFSYSCVYMGYAPGEYYCLSYEAENTRIFLTILELNGEKSPADFFEKIPFGSLCNITVKREYSSYGLSQNPNGDTTGQYNHFFINGSKTGKIDELSFEGIVRSVYNPDNGKRIEMILEKVNEKNVISSFDFSTHPEWFFIDYDNFTSLTDSDYFKLYKQWKIGEEKNCDTRFTIFIKSGIQETKNVWAPSESTSVKHYWIIKDYKYYEAGF